MSKPGSSATDMRKRALKDSACRPQRAVLHVGVLPADREFVSRFRDALLLPVDHRKTEGGAWGGRTPTGSLLIDDDETVDVERAPGKGIRRSTRADLACRNLAW